MLLLGRSRKMSKVTSEKRRRLRETLLITSSLAMVLASTSLAMAQESLPTETPVEQVAAPYQNDLPPAVDDGTSGPEPGSAGQPIANSSPSVSGYQNDEIGGGPVPTNEVALAKPDSARQPDSDPVQYPDAPSKDQKNDS